MIDVIQLMIPFCAKQCGRIRNASGKTDVVCCTLVTNKQTGSATGGEQSAGLTGCIRDCTDPDVGYV